MNIGLMMPPIGIGFYVACRIGDVSPDEVMGAIWPYIAALLVGPRRSSPPSRTSPPFV